MNQQETLDQLQELKLSGMAKRYEAIIRQPLHQHPESHSMVALLTEAEKVTEYISERSYTYGWLN